MNFNVSHLPHAALRIGVWSYATAALCLFLVSCDMAAERQRSLLDQIQHNVELTSKDEGPVAFKKQQGVWRSYLVRVTNRFTAPVYIQSVPHPKSLSDYLKEGNPVGYTFRIMRQGDDGKWQDANFGLSMVKSKDPVPRHEIPPGGFIEFRVPVRLHQQPMDGAQALKPRITVYSSREDRNGTSVESTVPNTIPTQDSAQEPSREGQPAPVR